jgi:DNA anti-recombination protein RmuC
MLGKLLFFAFLFFLRGFFAGAQAQDTGPWFLISESELRSIEEYRMNTETERQTLLSQVSELKTLAGRLNGRAESSRTESENLNRLLSQERETGRKLTASFSEYEAEVFRTISRRDTRIGQLAAENEKLSGENRTLLTIVIAAGAAVLLFAVFKILRFFKKLPF